MINNRIINQAESEHQRKINIKEKLFSISYLKFLFYIFYRNRFPLLTRICSRLILAVEYYLIYRLFFRDAFLSFSFVFILLFFLKSLFDGLLQDYRVKIALIEGELNSKPKIDLIQQACFFSICFSMLISCLVLGATFLLSTDKELLIFVAIKLLILPLQYLQSVLWMAIYTKQRERLNFIFLICCRLLPVLIILALHSILGIYSFIIGTFLGLLLKYIYLLKVSLKRFQFRIYKSLVYNLKATYSFHRQTGITAYSLPTVSYAIYNIGLAGILYAHSDNYWQTHVIFLYFLILFSYPTQRLAYSISMDIFLTLMRCNLPFATRLVENTKKLGVLLTLLIVMFCTVAFISYPAIFSSKGTVVYDLFIYFIIFFIGRLLFEFDLTLLRSAAIDGRRNQRLFLFLIFILLPLQAYLILFWRANLALVYLADFLFFLGLIINWRRETPLAESPFYLRALTIEKTPGLMAANQWLKEIKFSRLADRKNFPVYLLLTNAFYQKKFRFHLLVSKIHETFPELQMTEFLPGVLICHITSQEDFQADELRKRFSGHLRYVEELSLFGEAATDYSLLRKELALLKGLHPQTARILKLYNSLTTSKIVSRCQKLNDQSCPKFSSEQLVHILRQLDVSEPIIILGNNQTSGRIRREFRREADLLFLTQKQQGQFYKKTEKYFCQIQQLDRIVVLVDLRDTTDEKRLEIREICLHFTILLSQQEIASWKRSF